MIKKDKNRERSPKRLTELVGIDFSTTGTKVVRLRKTKNGFALVDLELLPPEDFNRPGSSFELPKRLVCNYGCLAYSGSNAVVRMVNAPVDDEELTLPESKLRELMNVNVNEDYRVAVKLIHRGKNRKDSSFLAAAIPQHDLRYMLGLFPAGPPAPASVEVAGLSFVSAFLQARGEACKGDSVCLLETGETSSHFVFLNQNEVSLVGKLSFGVRAIRQQIAKDLTVDDELAGSILADRSIDISSSVRTVLEPCLKQLSISMDFLQRHQGTRVSKLFLSGGMSLVPCWESEVARFIKADVTNWHPLENIEYDSAEVSEELVAQSTRFAAAIGAAIGGLQ